MSETKKKIADTFIKLLESSPYSKISIKDICTATPTSRNTFYYYFEGKEAVVEWIASQHYLKYCLPYFKIKQDNIAAKSFFQYILDYRSFYTAIFKVDQGSLLQKCLRAAYDLGLEKQNVLEYAKPVVSRNEKVDYHLCLCYCNAGTAAVVSSWIEGGMRIPIEKMARDLSMMMTNSLEEIRDHYLY